jgi:hypothetical protein
MTSQRGLPSLDPAAPIGFFQQEIMHSLARHEVDPLVHKYVPMADIRAGRVVSREAILATIDRMRIEQGE